MNGSIIIAVDFGLHYGDSLVTPSHEDQGPFEVCFELTISIETLINGHIDVMRDALLPSLFGLLFLRLAARLLPRALTFRRHVERRDSADSRKLREVKMNSDRFDAEGLSKRNE